MKMKKWTSRTRKFGASPMAVLLVAVASAVSSHLAVANGMDYEVKILFDDAECPLDTMFNGTRGAFPTLKDKKDRIWWQAYNKTGANKEKYQYKIYFTPFKNDSIPSRSDGDTKKKKPGKEGSIPVSKPGYDVYYKYTIWADNCQAKPLDPRFKVI